MVYPLVSSNVRITKILEVFLKLLWREAFSSKSLVRDYNVTSRTIKRDIDFLRDTLSCRQMKVEEPRA